MNKRSELLEGNLFECMRMIIPEHRKLMKGMELMAKTKSDPIDTFDEYKQIEMMELLQEAIENGLEVSITLKAGRYQGRQIITGFPRANGQNLYVNNQRVPLEKVVEVNRV